MISRNRRPTMWLFSRRFRGWSEIGQRKVSGPNGGVF